MEHPSRLVIADDLTGANDSGIHFLSEETAVLVIVDPNIDESLLSLPFASTLVVNTNTRSLPQHEAYTVVQHIVGKFTSLGPSAIYKKIDSTLRGNVGAEIDAVMGASGARVACVAPATPRNGRTVRNGLCYVNGVLLAATEVANDPFTPVDGSDIRKIIASQTDRRVGLFPLETIRASKKEAMGFLTKMIESGDEIIVADAETFEDLMKVKDLFSTFEEKVLYVGAAGFFHALGYAVESDPTTRHKVEHIGHRRILVVVGSMMETSVAQISWLKTTSRVECIQRLVTKEAVDFPEVETERLVNAIGSGFESSSVVLLHTDRDNSRLAGHVRVGAVLGKVVHRVIDTYGIDTLVVTGGDTAMHILRGLGVDMIELIEESLPGIPVGKITVPNSRQKIIFISKAGSFGDPDALEKVLDYADELGSTWREEA
jgi:uncharacterized protein YgbK (DUF1537 family)